MYIPAHTHKYLCAQPADRSDIICRVCLHHQDRLLLEPSFSSFAGLVSPPDILATQIQFLLFAASHSMHPRCRVSPNVFSVRLRAQRASEWRPPWSASLNVWTGKARCCKSIPIPNAVSFKRSPFWGVRKHPTRSWHSMLTILRWIRKRTLRFQPRSPAVLRRIAALCRRRRRLRLHVDASEKERIPVYPYFAGAFARSYPRRPGALVHGTPDDPPARR